MRIFNTYGPRMRPNDGRAIPNFINQALSGAPITVQGDGSQTRSVCHVDDLVEGALRLLFSDLTGPVNIGNPHEMTILELADLVRELTGSDSAVEFIDRAQDDPSQRQPDITLARTELQWEPKVNVRDGLLDTIAWFRDRAEFASQVGSPAPLAGPGRARAASPQGRGHRHRLRRCGNLYLLGVPRSLRVRPGQRFGARRPTQQRSGAFPRAGTAGDAEDDTVDRPAAVHRPPRRGPV